MWGKSLFSLGNKYLAQRSPTGDGRRPSSSGRDLLSIFGPPVEHFWAEIINTLIHGKKEDHFFFKNNPILSHRSKVKRRRTRSWSFLRTRLHFGSCQVIVRLHLDFYLHMFYFFGWSLTAITAKVLDFIPFCHERQLPTVNFQIWIILPANWNRQWTGIRSNISYQLQSDFRK